MNTKAILIVIAMIVIAGGYLIYQKNQSINRQLSTPASQSTPGQVSDPNETIPITLTVTTGNFFFQPHALTAKKGRLIRINFKNTGEHTFTIDGLNINKKLINETEIIEFTPDRVGTFEIYCAVAGHKAAGMVGQLVVEE